MRIHMGQNDTSSGRAVGVPINAITIPGPKTQVCWISPLMANGWYERLSFPLAYRASCQANRN